MPRDVFGLAFTGIDGTHAATGDAAIRFSIQSISKPFVYALVCGAIGGDDAARRVGVNATGLPFDSQLPVDHGARATNPMVNAGAIVATSLIPGETADGKWRRLLSGLSDFAGRALTMNPDVYRSEAANNLVNQTIANEMARRGRLYFDPLTATDIYTRQYSVEVTVADLSVMSATLANGGRNPITGVRATDPDSCRRVLAVLATAGLYERTGEWLYETGLPAKSGVSGGLASVALGVGGLAAFSPLVDSAGTSVRGQLAIKRIGAKLGLGIFAEAGLPANSARTRV